MSTPIMSELFEKHDLNYDLRPKTDFSLHSVNAVAQLKYFAGKVWSIVPFEIRNAKIKSWRPEIVHVGCV